jgi:peptidoglycan hydrolase-like protein with peptidoglycan-binding domain
MRRKVNSAVVATVSVVVTSLIIAVSCVALLVVVGVGNFQSTQEGTKPLPAVVGSVDVGAVERSMQVQVHAIPAFSVDVLTAQLGAGIVTSAAPPEGSALEDGALLLKINEVPVIVIEGSTPAYRSLGPGMRGHDVKQLQDYLKRTGYDVSDEVGVFGQSTAWALSAHDEKRGFPAVGADGAPSLSWWSTGLPLSRYVFVPSTPVLVGSGCGARGQSADALKCTLDSQSQIVGISDSSEEVLTGLRVVLQTKAGKEVVGVVGDVFAPMISPSADDFSEPADETQRWYAVREVPTDQLDSLTDSAMVIVDESAADGFRVPATAIRENPDGSMFIREFESESDGSPDVDHLVEVVLCADGYCAVRGEGISEGMKAVLLG